jgi:hypothetical protein
MSKIIAPERTFTRARRCGNCVHYEYETKSHEKWNIHRAARITDYLGSAPIARLADMENPNWSPAEMKDARLQDLHKMDHMIARGIAGICLKGPRPKAEGGPEGDFVHSENFCDRWTGISGHSLATQGHDDKLNEELHEIADDRAEKV